jgi:hypothetical protein
MIFTDETFDYSFHLCLGVLRRVFRSGIRPVITTRSHFSGAEVSLRWPADVDVMLQVDDSLQGP